MEAKDSAYGSTASTYTTSQAPSTPAIGSTMPEAWPMKKLLLREKPSLRNGTDTAAGSTASTYTTSQAPSTPAIGSTMPEAWPMKKLLLREKPSLRNGTDTAAPSGKFCSPMPTATDTAPISASGVHPR